ncbi:SPOR domain-containing protein [Nitrogeniibacter mangrovi]|uniref:SPOR domain-containing protein n=1 Tax=Nitrogeniibacter mangrovi TaxID=2016596 RepID=A0A6C1B3E5_9RHOO|nr:SPOR domain-containing protein [Nitrogeniibacter mangrovi]QID18181.1 SPOR domain-containing protein [Nitrogeniibacter mangrovi]
MANDDAQTDLKKRARRRLVGAAALALFAVIVLPMIMDPEPKPVGEDIEVRIPAVAGDNVAARTIDVPATPPVAEPVKRPEPAPVATPSHESVAKTSTPEHAPAPAKTSESPKPAPAVKATPSASPEVTTSSVEKRSEEAQRVAAILSGDAAKAPAADDKGPGFVVQVGAFANAGSAAALAEKIRQAGFKAYTRKVGSTTRVRVGPYENRNEAESVADRMAGKGFKGVVMPRG